MNAKIEQCRAVALDLMKPSKRDLDHGLGLHKESLVWDAYGFAPTSAGDPKVFARAIANGAGENEWRQLVEEMAMTRHVNDPVGLAEYKEAWDAAGVTCVFQPPGRWMVLRNWRSRQSRLSETINGLLTGRPALPRC